MRRVPGAAKHFLPGSPQSKAGLSFVAPDKLKQYAFLDEDLSGAGLTKLLPSKATYFRSYLCRGCELYIIDYSTALGRQDAERVAESLTPSG